MLLSAMAHNVRLSADYVRSQHLRRRQHWTIFNSATTQTGSCPLTPFENRVRVAVRAGEKLFRGASHELGLPAICLIGSGATIRRGPIARLVSLEDRLIQTGRQFFIQDLLLGWT